MSQSPKRPRAVLVAVQLPDTPDAEATSSLDELHRLSETLGLRPVARLTQRRKSFAAAALFGAGKLRLLARLTGGTGVVPQGVSRRPGRKTIHPWERDAEEAARDADAEEGDLDADASLAAMEDGGEEELGGEADPDEAAVEEILRDGQVEVVVVDHDLSPSQLRNLEGATSAEVLDRTSVILEIFQRHARTREAQIQVEIARLVYLAPRLRETGGGDRQRGGIGGKGAGESAAELDRRKVRDRIAELRRELAAVQREAATRRSRRVEQRSVAVVGYTNAGKSSLMRGLSASEVLVADKLFATLDTTVRVLHPETRPRILISDTVGFIKKLPHDLVASFRSTLEEARDAGLLLHVLDASDPAFRSHREVTDAVLAELGAGDRPQLLVLNKVDQLTAEQREDLFLELPDAMQISALDPRDVARVHARIVQHFERDMVEDELFVSYATPRRMHDIHEACRVLWETHEEDGTRVRVRAPRDVIDRLRVAPA